MAYNRRTFEMVVNPRPYRKRGRSWNAPVGGVYKKRRIASAQKGYVRTTGYYGRFSGKPGEMKFFDTDKTGTTVAAAGTVLNSSLLLIPDGTTQSTRIGRKITVKHIFVHGHLILPATTTPGDTSDRVRIIMYLDKQCNGAAAAVSDILTATDVNSFRNLSETGRFHILYDKVHSMNASSGTTAGAGGDQFGEYMRGFSIKKACNYPIEYNNTTGAIGEIRSNNVGIIAISASGHCTATYKARVRYLDQ